MSKHSPEFYSGVRANGSCMYDLSLSLDWCAERRAELLLSHTGCSHRQSRLPLNCPAIAPKPTTGHPKFDTEHLGDIKSKVSNGRVAVKCRSIRAIATLAVRDAVTSLHRVRATLN